MPYINVDEAYILDNTGRQVDNSVDYANANSNRNLLDNPWWGSGEIVNQYDFSSATLSGNKYYFDRWMVTYSLSAGTITATANGIRATPATGDNVQFIQKFLNPAQFDGKTVTFSMMISDGTIYSGTITRTNGTAQVVFRTGNVGAVFQSDNTARFIVYGPMTIRALKVEIGSYSTLLNECAPEYEEELAKCQFYHREIKCTTGGYSMLGFSVASTAFRVMLPFKMRVRPSVQFTGNLTAYYSGGNAAITAISPVGSFSDIVQLECATSGLPSSSIVALGMADGSKIVLTADL